MGHSPTPTTTSRPRSSASSSSRPSSARPFCATSSATPTRFSLPSRSPSSLTSADAGPGRSSLPSSRSPACCFGTWLGTFAPWADHTRIGPNHVWLYLQPFLSIVVVQIFFIGSSFFAVAALTRKIFIVYLQGVALFMIYVIGITVFSATRSLERFWSGILDPIGLILLDDVTRYWTVVEKNTLFVTWSPARSTASFSTTACSGSPSAASRSGDRLGAVPDVRGGAHRPLAGPPRRQGEAAGAHGGPAGPLLVRRSPPRRSSGLHARHHVRPIPLALPPPHSQHSSRHTVLGHCRPDGRLRDQQRTISPGTSPNRTSGRSLT